MDSKASREGNVRQDVARLISEQDQQHALLHDLKADVRRQVGHIATVDARLTELETRYKALMSPFTEEPDPPELPSDNTSLLLLSPQLKWPKVSFPQTIDLTDYEPGISKPKALVWRQPLKYSASPHKWSSEITYFDLPLDPERETLSTIQSPSHSNQAISTKTSIPAHLMGQEGRTDATVRSLWPAIRGGALMGITIMALALTLLFARIEVLGMSIAMILIAMAALTVGLVEITRTR